MPTIDSGLTAWRQAENHNRMIDLQRNPPPMGEVGPVEIAFFGSSAFRITTPGGVSVMIDPWRNHPSGSWDWYYYDMPETAVDIGVSTHAHFDHDALHLLNAHTLLDRPIGRFEVADVAITGIADKHVSDSSGSLYDWCALTRRLTGVDPRPPHNPRSFDNCLVLIETGGLRILHWGDNRADPPAEIWELLGRVDVALLPVERSRHVLTYEQADRIADRLGARVVIPHHYFIWDVTTRGSTLMEATEWVDTHPEPLHLDTATWTLTADEARGMNGRVVHFGDHVAFERPKPHWLDGVPEGDP